MTEPRRLKESRPYDEAARSIATALLGGRVLVILGAGASDYTRFGTRVLSERAREHLRVSKAKTQLPLDRVVRRYFRKRTAKDCTLEELLSLYNEPYDLSIPDFLDENGIRSKAISAPAPTLTYELLAHLVSYGLIREIISFNFDEGLEAALDDEIGPTNYEWIHSDNTFHKFAKQGLSAVQHPAIIKPHGTISFPGTICPSVETVQTFEPHKRTVIEEALVQASVLLILGFSSPDPDFQKTITELPLFSSKPVYWVDTDPHFPDTNYAFKVLREDTPAGRSRTVFVEASADDFLSTVTKIVNEREPRRCPDSARHYLRCAFHNWGAIPSVEQLFKLETLVYAIKTGGRFSLEELFNCRRIDSIGSRVHSSLGTGALRRSIDEMADAGFLKRDPRVGTTEAYYVPVGCIADGEEDPDVFRLLDFNGSSEQRVKAADLLHRVRETLGIDLGWGGPHNYLYAKFNSPTLVYDHVSLYERTAETLRSVNKHVYVVSESGSWLCSQFSDLLRELAGRGVGLSLIAAEPGPEDQSYRAVHDESVSRLKDIFGAKKFDVSHLPWDRHSVHMTLGDGTKAIYFGRRYTTTTVLPVYIDQRKDYNIVRDELHRIVEQAGRWSATQRAG